MSIQIPTVADGEETQTLASYTLSTEEVQAGVMCYLSGSTPVPVTTTNRLPIVLSDSQMTTLTPPAAITGFATSAKQDTQITHLGTLAGAVSGTEMQVDVLTMPTVAVTGTFYQATQPISAASLPLPSGAATESTLSSLNGKVTACNTGAVVISSALPAGTNAIGKLAANSGVDIGDVDVTSAPARSATTDTITAKLATDAIMNGTAALTPKFAVIAASSSGNNTLVAAVTSKKIRVLAALLISNGSVNVKFQSGASGTDLTGLAYLVANTGFTLPFNPVGWFETGSNTLLNLNLSGAVAIGGMLVYVEV